MSINKPLFDKIYEECLQIIKESNDKNILFKQSKLETAYIKLCLEEDPELQEFYSIIHELRLYNYMKNLNIPIYATNDNKAGPDFLSDLGYIECVCLTKGIRETPQRQWLDNQLNGSLNRYLSALPRLTSVILDKQKKFSQYSASGILDPNIPQIIAVNTSIFSNEFHSELNLSLTLKVLYGIGCEAMYFDTKTNSFIGEKGVTNHVFDDIGIKPPFNTELHLNYFMLESFRNISALLLINNSVGEKLIKNYFNLLLNPIANIPIDLTLLKGIKYFALINIENGYANYQWFNQ